MSSQLNILLVEDSEDDEILFRGELKKWGYTLNIRRVVNEAGMRRALDWARWDIVVCEYSLPGFPALAALSITRQFDPDIPFIILSRSIGEGTAVAAMKLGAHDYVMKGSMGRLVPAMEREIREARARRAHRQAETLFQAVLRASFHPTVIIDRSTERIVYASDSFLKKTVIESAATRERSLFDLIHFTHPERIKQLLDRGQGTAWYIVYVAQGEKRVANVFAQSVDHGDTNYACLVLEDVTEQFYLKAAFDAVTSAVLIVSSSDRLLYANRAAEVLFDQLVFGSNVAQALNRVGIEPSWWRTARADQEIRFTLGEEAYRASTVAFRYPGETEASAIVTFRSVTHEERLLELATHDPLTGLYNLRFLSAVIEQRLEATAEGKRTSYVAIDLDRLKPINDELGHAAGDAALMAFGKAVRSEIRGRDIFARTGGDEFAIVFPDAALRDAKAVIDRIYARLEASPFIWEGEPRMLGFSSGLAAMRGGETMEELRERADRCLYLAKENGRGQCVVEG